MCNFLPCISDEHIISIPIYAYIMLLLLLLLLYNFYLSLDFIKDRSEKYRLNIRKYRYLHAQTYCLQSTSYKSSTRPILYWGEKVVSVLSRIFFLRILLLLTDHRLLVLVLVLVLASLLFSILHSSSPSSSLREERRRKKREKKTSFNQTFP